MLALKLKSGFMGKELTGKPTAMLSRAILFIPARKLIGPVNVNSRCSKLPKADPVLCVTIQLH